MPIVSLLGCWPADKNTKANICLLFSCHNEICLYSNRNTLHPINIFHLGIVCIYIYVYIIWVTIYFSNALTYDELFCGCMDIVLHFVILPNWNATGSWIFLIEDKDILPLKSLEYSVLHKHLIANNISYYLSICILVINDKWAFMSSHYLSRFAGEMSVVIKNILNCGNAIIFNH